MESNSFNVEIKYRSNTRIKNNYHHPRDIWAYNGIKYVDVKNNVYELYEN